MGEITIRRATIDDAEAIARVHVRAWQQAYAHLLSAEFLDGLDVGQRARGWQGILVDGVTDAFVALAGDTTVGWATAGPGREPDAPRPTELEGIYVLAEHHGSGAGQRLLDAVVGDRAAYLWRAADNPRADAFYRRNGFTLDGGRKEQPIGAESIDTVRMVR